MKKRKVGCFCERKRHALVLSAVGMLISVASLGQTTADGNNGLQEANNLVRKYYADGTNLMYAVGAILGLIGAVKVYGKWSHGDPDTGKTAAAWFGSCIFLVVVATVIKQFFGIT